MRSRKVLVTGATGFIGGRLIEKLILQHGADVRALVRNFSRASRLSRFDVEMVPGGIADAEAVDRAVRGCEVVFHCAHDFPRQNVQQNLDGTRILAEACLRHRVRRLVHVSTISVYEPLGDGALDESAPAEPCGWSYPDTKLEVERTFLRYWKDEGLPVVVLQPTIVYGPFARSWTVNLVRTLRAFRVVLPEGGVCNAVYVDDVVDALIAAAQKEVIGERLLISGPETVSWRDFYGAFERMTGLQRVVMMSNEEIVRSRRVSQPAVGLPQVLELLRRDPRRLARRIVNWPPMLKGYRLAQKLMGADLAAATSRALPAPLLVPEEQMLALYGARATVVTAKAKRLLAYEPAFGFERGMNLTAQYVRWAKL